MSEKKVFEYEIGGKKYTQEALVWAQIKQLKNLLSGTRMPEDLNVMSVIDTFEEAMPKAVAIVLREDGQKLKEKNIDDLAEMFEEHLELETMVDVVENFFLCNRIGSLLQKIGKVFGNLTNKIDLTSLTEQLQHSQKETSQKKTKSSGNTHRKKAAQT